MAGHENITAVLVEDEISLASGSTGNGSEEGTAESSQLRSEEVNGTPASRNGIFENPSLHEIDLSAPLCESDSTMPRNTERQGACLPFEKRLSCTSVSCLLTLVLACVLLVSGRQALQRLGGALFGVAVVLCIMVIVGSVMHGNRQGSQSGHTQHQTAPETPLNFDISQARTEWLMSTIEVDDKDKPPSYNMVTRAFPLGEKTGHAKGSDSYFMHFPTNLFSTTDCENCEDITNPPPSYESILDLILPSSQRNTTEEEPITITCVESPRENAQRDVTHDERDTTLEQRSREDRIVVAEMNEMS